MAIHHLNAIPPFVQVGLSVGLSFRMRGLGGPPIGVNALIDTGASQTAVAPRLIRALAPQPAGNRNYLRPGTTPIGVPTYSVLLCFEPDLGDKDWVANSHWFPVLAAEISPATPGADVLIGQDLLAHLALSWDGPRGRLLLMY